MVTIYDLSQESGFSPSTVSKALNNYSGVNASTREKILQAAKKIGYTPNANARALKAKFSQNLGVLFYLRNSLDLTHYFFIQVLNEFKRLTESRGYDITLLSKGEDAGAQAFVKHCHMRQLDGVLILGDYTSDLVQELMISDIPCVAIDYAGGLIPGVTSDNYEKTRELVSRLIGMGHERILFLTGEFNFVTEERKRGYADAFREVNKERLPCVEARYYDADLSAEYTEKYYPALKPTAIIYPDDFSATGGVNALRGMGLSIPDDVSVATFDGGVLSRVTSPTLTCVRQNAEGIGRALATKLLAMIENGDDKIEQIVVEAQLQFTESCRRLKV